MTSRPRVPLISSAERVPTIVAFDSLHSACCWVEAPLARLSPDAASNAALAATAMRTGIATKRARELTTVPPSLEQMLCQKHPSTRAPEASEGFREERLRPRPPSPAAVEVRWTSDRSTGCGANLLFGRLAKPSPRLMWNERLLGPHPELLDGPGVAVGVGETEEGSAVPFVEDRDVAHLDAAVKKPLASGLGVGNAELQTLHRTRLHLALHRQVAEHDRAAGTRRSELDHVHVLVVGVVVEVETNLVAIKADRTIDIAHGQDDNLESPIQDRSPFVEGREQTLQYGLPGSSVRNSLRRAGQFSFKVLLYELGGGADANDVEPGGPQVLELVRGLCGSDDEVPGPASAT